MLQQLKKTFRARSSIKITFNSLQPTLFTTTFSVSKNFLFSTTLFQSHTNRRAWQRWLFFLNIQFLSISTWILRLLSHRDTICVWSRRYVSCVFFVVVCWCWHGPPQRTTRMAIKRTGRDLWIQLTFPSDLLNKRNLGMKECGDLWMRWRVLRMWNVKLTNREFAY